VIHEDWSDAVEGSTDEPKQHSEDSTVFQHTEKLVAGVKA
jgi:hypothetical protein